MRTSVQTRRPRIRGQLSRRRAGVRRLGVLVTHLLLRHEVLLRLIGRLNRRIGFIKAVYVAYPARQDYADAYLYRWAQRRCRWSPWVAGIYRQDGALGLMTMISSSEDQFYDPADPTHNLSHLEALLKRTQHLRALLGADQVRFAGILPGLLYARGLRSEGPEVAVTVEALLQAERHLRVAVGYEEHTPLILLGGKGYIGRRFAERLSGRETYVVDVLPGQAVNDATWPSHLKGRHAILINLTKKAVLSDYMALFWEELVVLNEVYPEPSADEIQRLSAIGVKTYHVVGVRGRAFPGFPFGYAGGIPCCAAWQSSGMEVVVRRLA
jgi:hypothetical protein